MKKIIPFKKDIIFKNHLSEITSISLEHSLHIADNNLITGEFIVSGDYRMTDSSTNTEDFSYNLPFDIIMDDHYLLDHVEIDIDDFYYEIKDNNILSVNIEVLIDRLEDKPLIQEKEEDEMEELFDESSMMTDEEPVLMRSEELDAVEEQPTVIRSYERPEVLDTKMDEAVFVEKKEVAGEIKSLFDSFDESNETYATYHVYILRESDTIETVLQKYNVSKEDLEFYNDLKELKIGDKIIIPSLNA